jgi:hypothetical protein
VIKLKKWLIILSSMALLVPTSALANVDGNRSKSENVSFVAAQSEVSLKDRYEFLHDMDILKGKGHGKHHFDASLTRAELAVSLYRLFKLEKEHKRGKDVFKDTHKHWAKDEINFVAKMGWMGAAEKGNKFNHNKTMTIEEVAKVLVKATGLNVGSYASIWLPASSWSQGYLAAALTEGFLTKEENYRAKAKRSHLIYSLYEVYHYKYKDGGIVAGTLEPKASIEKMDRDSYKWTFTVKNQTEKEQIVNISGSKFDYTLRRNGQKVEQYTDNKKFIMLYQEARLKQGETLTFNGELTNLPKGKYELEIWLIDTNWPNAKTKIKFEVE